MKLLDRLSECLDSAAARNACLEQFRASGKMSSGSAAGHAADTLANIRELCSSHGINLGDVTDWEIARFVQESNTKIDGYFCATEYQDLVTKIAKYAALKARRHPRARWTLGVALSAAGAVAASAVLPVAAAASTGRMMAAAPAGAAVGALALSLDSRSMSKRDRRRATRHVPRKPKAAAAPAAPAAAEIGAEQDTTVLTAAAAAPAGPAEEQQLAASSVSEELISAVVEVDSAADSPAKAVPEPASLAAPVASAFAAAATAEEPAVPLLPALLRSASPEAPSSSIGAAPSTEDSIALPGTPGSDVDAAAFDGALTAGLPPLAVKPKGKDQKPVSSTKALKKGLSKSFKSVKKAFSMNSTGSSSMRSSLDIASPNASITTPSNARPPLPASGAAAFLRRSFSKDSRDVVAVADKAGSLLVQPSEGSATLHKMRDALRRSFTISTPRGGSRRASVDSAF